MRALRTLAAACLAVSLLAIPAATAAQADVDRGTAPAPLARQPDGRLPLQGTPWRLVSYVDRGREAVPGPEVAAFIEFGPRFHVGSGGCSRIEGEYGVNGAALRVRLKQLDERACAENQALVQQAVEGGLRRAAAYDIEASATELDDQLVIYSVTGEEVLRYAVDDLTLLEGPEWRLESYTVDGRAVPSSEEMPGLLSFQPNADAFYKRRQSGPLSGTSGCNAIVAEFSRHADVLSLSELTLTDAPCTDELAAQEAAMTAVLGATAIRLDLPADRLVLTSTDTDERLEFVSQTPVEGTTWWLERTAADGSIGGQRITLRLADGVASGEGPCGPYAAAYVTDGIFVTFAEARGARDEDCSELRTERALISGLRRSVVIERGTDRLAFLDAQGNQALSFARPFGP